MCGVLTVVGGLVAVSSKVERMRVPHVLVSISSVSLFPFSLFFSLFFLTNLTRMFFLWVETQKTGLFSFSFSGMWLMNPGKKLNNKSLFSVIKDILLP